MMISRYILPLFIALLVGALILKGLRAGRRAAPDEGANAGQPAAVTRAERPPIRADLTRSAEDGLRNHVAGEELGKCVADATALFKERDFASALKRLDRVEEISSPSAKVLNLRGSCHARLRDFGKALADFEKAADLAEGNSSVCFNVGEVYFVTRQWQRALDSFEELHAKLPSEDVAWSRLVVFKILLCKNGLGRVGEVGELAGKYDAGDSSPFHWYASASLAFEAGDESKALKLLHQASLEFPNRDLEPWNDTMMEYRG